MLDTYTPLLENRLEDLKVTYSTKGKEFTQQIKNNLHYTGTLSTIPVKEIHDVVESSMKVTLLNRGRTKSEAFALNSRTSVLNGLNGLNGESARLVKIGIFLRRERMSTRFGRLGGWQWIETGIILFETKLMFIKGDLSNIQSLIVSEQYSESDETTIIPPLGSEITFELTGMITFYDSGINNGPTDFPLRLISLFGGSEILCLPNEDILNEWIGMINYLSAIQSTISPPQDMALDPSNCGVSPTILRRRAGTIAPPASRQIPLRAVSSTLELRGRSKSEQPPLPLSPSTSSSSTSLVQTSNKILLYTTFQKDLIAKLDLQKMRVDSMVRQARGLLIQTPLQEKTRLAVLNALERVCKRLKVCRIEMERAVCYIDVLEQVIQIIGERKIRLVEKETDSEDSYQLPLLVLHQGGRERHRKSRSDDTVDTMLSSTTLYTALNPVEDTIGVPIRKIGTPSRNAKITATQANMKDTKGMEGKRSESSEKTVIEENSILSGHSLGKYDSGPAGIMERSGSNSLRAENKLSSTGDTTIHVAEL